MTEERAVLVIRRATLQDIPAIQELSARVYGTHYSYAEGTLTGQINRFPDGQFVALYKDKLAGYCASIRLKEERATAEHTWRSVTGGGYGSTHDPEGDVLYGMEVMVDPEFRGLRIGQRFYRERIALCKRNHLHSIVFAGRLPLLKKNWGRVKSPEEYIQLVKERKIKDPVLSFQLREGYEIIRILNGYLPYDAESMGYAALMRWRNPEFPDAVPGAHHVSPDRFPQTIRVATVQYMQRAISSFAEFESIVTYFVDVVSDYKADFVCFPELFTLQLLSIENEQVPPEKAIEKLTEYTEPLKRLFNQLAIKYNVNIIAGSHPTRVAGGDIQNICYICLRDGSVHEQPKIHPTPSERFWWNLKGGDECRAIETDCGTIGVLICYDSEFPELGRHLIDQGADILFVPFCTDERQGYLRVRYSAQARAVENQCYVVLSGNVGNLPRVHNMDIQYAQSAILTPCDLCFARDGIAADTTPNVETVAFADLRLDDLNRGRNAGTVQNLKDRRHDLYSVVWNDRSSRFRPAG